MNPIVGWTLAALLTALAWRNYGWQGVVFAATLIVFWLLLQFSRSLRVLRNAAQSPVGHVESAVMLNAKLQRGMRMIDVLAHTRALGRKQSDEPESWAWADDSGATVTVVMRRARVADWTLTRVS